MAVILNLYVIESNLSSIWYCNDLICRSRLAFDSQVNKINRLVKRSESYPQRVNGH